LTKSIEKSGECTEYAERKDRRGFSTYIEAGIPKGLELLEKTMRYNMQPSLKGQFKNWILRVSYQLAYIVLTNQMNQKIA